MVNRTRLVMAIAAAGSLVGTGCWLIAGLEDRTLLVADGGDAGPACTTAADCDGAECFDERCDGRQPIAIATANRAACVVRRAGTVWCWGNPGSRVFDEDAGGSVTPVPHRIPVLHDVTDLEGGEQYFCALELGKVYCWGNNGAGTLGHDRGLDDPAFHNPTPIAVALPRPALRVAAGFRHVCALLNDQSVWCWGQNDFSQLGVEDAGGVNTTTPVMALPPGSGTLSLGAGNAHTCATLAGGPVKCWGANADLALGTPLPDGGAMSATPVVVPVPGNQGMITVGLNRACSQLVANTYCWGHPAWGSDAGAPVQVSVDGFQTMSGYGAHVCGVTQQGALRCWGTNTNGNLFPTETPDACAPGAVCGPNTMAVTNVVDVSAKGPSTLVVLADGQVMGWGYNGSAVLGHAPGTAGDVDCNALVPADAASTSGQQCNTTPQAHPYLP